MSLESVLYINTNEVSNFSDWLGTIQSSDSPHRVTHIVINNAVTTYDRYIDFENKFPLLKKISIIDSKINGRIIIPNTIGQLYIEKSKIDLIVQQEESHLDMLLYDSIVHTYQHIQNAKTKISVVGDKSIIRLLVGGSESRVLLDVHNLCKLYVTIMDIYDVRGECDADILYSSEHTDITKEFIKDSLGFYYTTDRKLININDDEYEELKSEFCEDDIFNDYIKPLLPYIV